MTMNEATPSSVNLPTEPPESLNLTGRTLGDYHILRRLGKGGMGEVYLAEQQSLKRNVALKILRGKLAGNPTALKRFQQEAKAVAQATHANIVQVYACDEVDGVAFMALEYVEGRNLRDFIRKKGPLDLQLVFSFMRQIAAALQRAGELGIIHRDIKPENILLNRKGEAKVADFGLSRIVNGDEQPLHLTRTGTTVGTPLYMAPEQIEGKPVDARTDIYAFGVTCYHMLAGAPPFLGGSAYEVVLAHIRTEAKSLRIVRPDAPPALCAIVHKMMAKDPADRYQSCRELLKDLSKVRESISGQVTALRSDGGGDLLPLNNLEEIATGTQTDMQTISLSHAAAIPRHWLALVLVFVAVGAAVVVLAGGAGLTWYLLHKNKSPAVAVPTGTQSAPPSTTQGNPNTPAREQPLRAAAEPYLTSVQTAKNNQSKGLSACMELGVFYLEQNKLEDANKLFRDLEDMRSLDSFRFLGRLGHAIVLALRNQSKESNALFKEVFSRDQHGFENFFRKGRDKGREQPATVPHSEILYDSKIHDWLLKAVNANEIGGVARNDVPLPLRQLSDSKDK
jgi:eukaryotic-like serine/threonine-protein kinase